MTTKSDLLAALEEAINPTPSSEYDMGESYGINTAIRIVKEHLAKHDNLTIPPAKLDNDLAAIEQRLHSQSDDPTGMYHKGVSDSFAAMRPYLRQPSEQAVDEEIKAGIYGAIYRTHNGELRNIDEVTDAVFDEINPYLRQPAPSDMRIAFTCERTGKRWKFGNIAEPGAEVVERVKYAIRKVGVDAHAMNDELFLTKLAIAAIAAMQEPPK